MHDVQCHVVIECLLASNAALDSRYRCQHRAARYAIGWSNMHEAMTEHETDETQDTQANPRIGTARELLQVLREEGIIGMWKDRDDIGDSVEFAQKRREQATSRSHDE